MLCYLQINVTNANCLISFKPVVYLKLKLLIVVPEFMTFINVCLLSLLIYDNKFHSIITCLFMREMVIWHIVNNFSYIGAFVI